MTHILGRIVTVALVLVAILIFGPNFIDSGKTLTVKVSNKSALSKQVTLRLVADNHEVQQEDLGTLPPKSIKNSAFKVPSKASLYIVLDDKGKPQMVNVYLWKNVRKTLNIHIDDKNTIKLIEET